MPVENTVEVWLHLKHYKFRVQHRVLNELGELSHFILSMFYKHNLKIESLYKITGLSQTHLEPILDRLHRLEFINDDLEITEKGRQIAYALINLHDKEIDIYIDQNYQSHNHPWFMVLGEAESLQKLPNEAVELPLPGRIRFDYVEDCFQQNQRFNKQVFELLPQLLPEFYSFYDQSVRHDGAEWNITFRSFREDLKKGLKIELPLKTYKETAKFLTTEKPSLRLYTPALKLTTRFKAPLGIDWQSMDYPEPLSLVYSENDDEIYTSVNLSENGSDGIELVNSEGSQNEQLALRLLQEIKNYHLDVLYSIEHQFSKGWQLHEYTYREVVERITNHDVIKGGGSK
ncbi:hypothetical protein ABVY78_001862 [Vibrio parahaemolyticus]